MSAGKNQRLSLRKNFAWTLFGSLIENGAKWAVFVVMAKLVTSEDVGTFSLALAVVTPITILMQLQLRVALITDAKDEYEFGAYYGLRLVTTALSMVLIAGIALAIYGAGRTTLLILIVGLGQALVSLRDIWNGLAQKYERMDVTSIGNMLEGVLDLVFFAAFLLVTRDVLWGAIGLVLGKLVALVGYDIRKMRGVLGIGGAGGAGEGGFRFAPIWKLAPQRALFVHVLPLGITTALVSLNSNIPRYFIEQYAGRDELGYFAAIAYIVFAARLVVSSLSRAASPRLAILYHQNRARYGKLLVKLTGVGVVMGAFGVAGSALLGPYVLRVAYSAEYAQQNHILVIQMIAGGLMFINMFFGMAISAARFFRVQTITYIIVVLATTAASALLVPRWGMEGAAWAGVVAAAVTTALNCGVVVHVYRAPASSKGAAPGGVIDG